MHLAFFYMPYVPQTLMSNHSSHDPLLKSQIAPDLYTPNILLVQETGAQMVLSLKVPGKRTHIWDP
jgi:hypothetical protein